MKTNEEERRYVEEDNKSTEETVMLMSEETKKEKALRYGKKALMFGVPTVALTALIYYGVKTSKDVDFQDFTDIEVPKGD